MTFAIPGLVFIATHHISFFNIEGVIFVILALLATLMVVSGVLSLLEGRVGALQRATAPRALGALAIATFLGVAALGVVARVGYASEAGHAGDLSLKMKDVKFSTDKLQSGSDVAINVANQDGTFHTFTIDGVVDKTVPASSNARVTFHWHLPLLLRGAGTLGNHARHPDGEVSAQPARAALASASSAWPPLRGRRAARL